MRKFIFCSLLLLSGFGIIHSHEGSEEETIGLLQISTEENPANVSDHSDTLTPPTTNSSSQTLSKPWSPKKAVVAFTVFLVATSFASDGLSIAGTEKIDQAAGPYTTYAYDVKSYSGHPLHPQAPNITHKPHCTYSELTNVSVTSIPYSAKGTCYDDLGLDSWCTLEACSMQPDEYEAYNDAYKLTYFAQGAGVISRLALLMEGGCYWLFHRRKK